MNRRIVIALIAASLCLGRGALAGPSKTTICHVPPGSPTKRQTISIGSGAVRAHLNNHPGDSVGACGSTNCGNGICNANLGETSASCVDDCGCACQAAVNTTGNAVDLGSVLGVGTANLVANVCSQCGNASDTSASFTFAPSVSPGSTAFTFTAGAVGAPQCSVIDDANGALGTVITSGNGTIAANAQLQSANFTLTLVRVAGLVCSGILVLEPADILGVSPNLTVPLSIPCGDSTLQTCTAP